VVIPRARPKAAPAAGRAGVDALAAGLDLAAVATVPRIGNGHTCSIAVPSAADVVNCLNAFSPQVIGNGHTWTSWSGYLSRIIRHNDASYFLISPIMVLPVLRRVFPLSSIICRKDCMIG
jgi:hypothetical protein